VKAKRTVEGQAGAVVGGDLEPCVAGAEIGEPVEAAGDQVLAEAEAEEAWMTAERLQRAVATRRRPPSNMR
jgi:hypothetical protein